MIGRLIFCWLLAAIAAWADIPRQRASLSLTLASPLVQGILLPNAAAITNQYDALSRLTGTALLNHWGHVLDGCTYELDPLGLRTNLTRNFGITTNHVVAGFDAIGQLTSWSAQETGGTARQNEQFGFAYDPADNLMTRTNGSLVQSFMVDPADQLTNVARTGTLTVVGALPAPATNVTVNGASAQLYGDFTFASTNHSLIDGANSFTNLAQNLYVLLATNTFTANLAASNSFACDLNGNLTSDGAKYFLWDAENRLTNVYVPSQWKLEFGYDGLGRRRVLKQYTWASSAWSKTNEVRYVFDGMQPIQERDTNSIPQVTYTRGLDLSGSLGGAGGIGGLLARTDGNGSTYYHSDGAGNITALMDGYEDIVARYLYGPFGKLLGQWGKLAATNTMQFSSMPYYSVAGLTAYYGRFYDGNLQRWLNPDPSGEAGGINLFGFNHNSPPQFVDPNGKHPLLIAFLVAAVWSAVMAPDPANAPGPNDPTYPPLSAADRVEIGATAGLITVATEGLFHGVGSMTRGSTPEPTLEPSPSPTPCPTPKPLFRAVTDPELKSIMDNGQFSTVPGSTTPIPGVEGKWFYESLADAQAWAKQAASIDGDTLTIVRTTVPDTVAATATSRPWLDGIANPAQFYSMQSLVNSLPPVVVSGPIQ